MSSSATIPGDEWFNAAYEGNTEYIQAVLKEKGIAFDGIDARGNAKRYRMHEVRLSGAGEEFHGFYYEDYYGERVKQATLYLDSNIYARESIRREPRRLEGYTALEFAAMMNNFDIVQLLHESGATVFDDTVSNAATDFLNFFFHGIDDENSIQVPTY